MDKVASPTLCLKKRIFAFGEMLKFRMIAMIWVTVSLGFFMANHFSWEKWPVLLFTLLGSGLCAGGAFIINQYLEIDVDRLMKRTENRPLPSGRIKPEIALIFSLIFILGGAILLWHQVNLLTSWLTLLIVISYDLIYTPMKRISWLNTTIGAIPGAIPPMIGWTAYTNQIGAEAWILFAIMFIWQHPHFFAIGWIYRKDYKSAGIKLLPTMEDTGFLTSINAVFYAALLIPICLIPTWRGLAGDPYFYSACLLGLFYLFRSLLFYRSPSEQSARKLLHASFYFVPLLALCFIADAYIKSQNLFDLIAGG